MARIFLFETEFEIGFNKSRVEVFKVTDKPDDVYYECIVDGDECYELWLSEDHEWFDYNGGKTNMSDIIGKVIDSNTLH